MRRTREIVGLPVLDLQTGDQVGWVQDLTFNEETDDVIGFLLEGAHFFQNNKGIPRPAVAAVGKDALTVNNYTVEELSGTKWSEKVGNQVYTQGGDLRGTIEDVFLDDSAQHIVGFEVSDGLFADLIHGRGAILQQQVMVDGKDILIVDDQVSPWEEDNKGGSLS
ncbi:MAG: PRC-barrel domain-containing protein [Desulfitobacteriaceae bacterium]